MATSGSVNFSLNRNEIITEALELAGVKDVEETARAAIITSCARTLNIMIKGWESEGIYLWKTRDFYVFPQKSTANIDLGPSGDHATLSYVKTEVATAASETDTEIVVDSDTGISDGDYIGIELDDGTLQWTTVNGAPSSDTITLDDALTDDVSVDANVYAYTTKINRPLYILKNGRLYVDSSGNENPFEVDSRESYNSLTVKTTTGNPNQGYYDPRTTNGRLSIWPTSNNVKNFLILTGKFPIEDFDGATDDADYPQEWYLALTWNLAVAIAPKFLKRSMDVTFIQMAASYLAAVSTHDKDWGSFFIEFER